MEQYRETEVVSMEVREITPAMASEMLGHNNGNRNLSQAKAQYYAKLMHQGSWRLTHQGIAVSESGNVIDGQHRLAAVAMHGKPVKFVVVTLRATDDGGELTAIAQPIDIGKKRSISDITEEPRDHVQICRTIIRDFVPNGNIRGQDPEIVAKSIVILRQSLFEINSRCGTTRKGLSVATIRAIMVLRHYMGVDVLGLYKDSLNERYERLPKSWVSWATRIVSMVDGTRIPKNADFRKVVAALTWQVTDPTKSTTQVVQIRKPELYIEEISAAVQEVLMPALTKSRTTDGTK